MKFLYDNYLFEIELDNANNILLTQVGDEHQFSVIKAIKQFILFLHKNKIQYVSIYDKKLKDRYSTIFKYLYNKGNNTERWLYNMASFINDEDVLLCKVY
jgi:hypothetical protein